MNTQYNVYMYLVEMTQGKELQQFTKFVHGGIGTVDDTLPETNIAHENPHLSWWIFMGYVSLQEGNGKRYSRGFWLLSIGRRS